MHCQAPLQASDERRVLCQPGLRKLRNLRHVNFCKTLTKCRDRHGQARPIICVGFWAITSSLCVSISLLSLPLFFSYNGTDFCQYISARIVWRGLILGSKKLPKNDKNSLLWAFFCFVLLIFLIFYAPAHNLQDMGAISRSFVSAQILLDISVCALMPPH